MEFQEMDPQRGIYQEAYSWSLELCMDFAEIEIFGQMESRFQNKVCLVHMQKCPSIWPNIPISATPWRNFVGHEQAYKFMYFGAPSMSYSWLHYLWQTPTLGAQLR